MKNKVGLVKISICAAFLALFAAPFFLSSALNITASETIENKLENPQNCAACHQEKHAAWLDSSHQKTVRRATAATVRGDFTAANHLEYGGAKVETRRDGDDFFIILGEQIYKVAAVVGAKYVEQYAAEKDGAFYSLPVAYNLSERRWMNLDDTVFQKKDANFSNHLKSWKTDCAACHRSGETDFSGGFEDFGISCGACHGSAAEHVQSKTSVWAKLGLPTESKIINPRNLSSDASMMVCAACHARESKDTPSIEAFAGDNIDDAPVSAHQPSESEADKRRLDGAYRFSGSEYQSILRSVCYVQSKSGGHGIAGEKINCLSCHTPHEANGDFAAPKSYDQSCISCHAQFSDAGAVAEHTKHAPDSEASNCVSCHQPETVYGRMRFTRTHEISVPNPLLTAEKGIPNACNLCHTDESVNWAIAASTRLWSERFRAAETSPDKQFDQPEGVRALSSNDDFLRALTADAIGKHSDQKLFDFNLFEHYQTEKSPLVKYFIDAAENVAETNLIERE